MIDLRRKAERPVNDLVAVSPGGLDGLDRAKAEDIVESYLLEAYSMTVVGSLRESSERSRMAIRACCGADHAMADRMAVEIYRSNVALIANLSGMR
jgi:hypothetical protein